MRIELDTTFGNQGETLEEAIAEVTAGTAVAAEVVNPHGPGGGWPIVAYEGDEAELAVVARRYGFDDADVAELLG